MDERNYFVEDAKSEQILFKGTKEECDEWTDEIQSIVLNDVVNEITLMLGADKVTIKKYHNVTF